MNVSCIIPAYNEGTRIGGVLAAATSCALITEIIVVNDGSTDDTAAVVRHYPHVTLLEHTHNKGKSASVYAGMQRATGDIIILLDADLLGLTPHDVENLILPIVQNRTDITISLRGNTPILWKYLGLDYISGERCFRRTLLDDVLESIKSLRSFSLEVFLNQLIITRGLKVTIVSWPAVRSPLKRKAFGISFDFLIIGGHILKEISVGKAFVQIVKMKRLMTP